jgi:hypothetical protein
MAEKDTGNGMIVLFNIPFIKFRCSHFLRCHPEAEVKEQCVGKKTPQHDPQTVLGFTQMADEPAGDKDPLHQPDKHGKVIGDGVFEKWYFHNFPALSIIKSK